MQHFKTQLDLRRVPFVRKPDPKPPIVDRLVLWFSTSRKVDGLWVGTMEGKPYPGLRRVEDALRLIKRHDSLHYSRVIHNLERIKVGVIPNARACYNRSLTACVFDERFVLPETTTLERIASVIIHEATHARLEGWGVSYDDEKQRARIEAICLRRELSFVSKLPHGEPLREEIARTLEWCIGDHDYFSNVSFRQRADQENVETLRYLGTPDWLIRSLPKVRAIFFGVRRLVHRFAGCFRGKRRNVVSSPSDAFGPDPKSDLSP
ncbi:hypothetical protein [Bradyrhizobium canariense]|uniref:hypothetical protein n=1 Tax=Bradyrhizobium canariense TaxID=255045 RepID=UPI00143204DC|nr:hypothetical protein [Bradyrhizobium canariense]